jgi:hypothetical protein
MTGIIVELVVVVVGAAILSVVLSRRWWRQWRRFARGHGLLLTTDEAGRPKVEGKVAGRRL